MLEYNKVLVADDEHDIGVSIALLLEVQGFAVELAATPKAAMRLAKLFQPHYAVIDIRFDNSKLTGMHLCRWFERHMPRCVRIAHTAYGGEEQRLKMRSHGFDRFLLKPCTLFNLLSALRPVQ